MENADESDLDVIMKSYKENLKELLADPLLNDLPSDVTLEELKANLALEFGQAMTVNVVRDDGQVLPIIINQDATVGEFKKAFERFMHLKMNRENNKISISWKHVWKTYWFVFAGQKLKDDEKKLKDYYISNHAEVTFIKR